MNSQPNDNNTSRDISTDAGNQNVDPEKARDAQQYPIEDIQQTDMFAPFFKRKRTWLVFIGFLLFAAAIFIIPIDVETKKGSGLDANQVRIGLGIFFCVAFLWLTEALPLAVTAILVPILGTLTGVFDIDKALSSFAHPLIFIFFGGFALASAMAYQGVDRWVANRVVIMCRGSLLLSASLLFGVTAFLSMWMSNTATTAMMIPLVIGILAQIGDDDKNTSASPTAIFLLLGVAYSASIGGIGTIIGSPPNGIAAKALDISFQQWMLFGIPAVVVLLPLMFAVLFITSRPAVGQRIKINEETFTFNWHRVTTLIIFAITAVCWVFSQQIGQLIGVTKSIDTVIALIAVVALLYFRVVRWRDIDRGTDWGVLMLFGGGLSLSAILKITGTSLFLAQIFAEHVSNFSLVMITLSIIAFIIFLTELSSNTATAALFVPIFMAVAQELGSKPAQFVIPVALAASCAFMLPVGTPPNAIVFGTGRIPQKKMIRVGLVLNLIFVVALTVLSRLVF